MNKCFDFFEKFYPWIKILLQLELAARSIHSSLPCEIWFRFLFNFSLLNFKVFENLTGKYTTFSIPVTLIHFIFFFALKCHKAINGNHVNYTSHKIENERVAHRFSSFRLSCFLFHLIRFFLVQFRCMIQCIAYHL